MEISVGFADTDCDEKKYIEEGYVIDSTELGRVFYKPDAVDIDEEVSIIYDIKPWLEAFRIEGMRPKNPLRRGPGTKLARDFVPDLLEIFDDALYLYKTHCETSGEFDASGYFAEVNKYFCEIIRKSEGQAKGSEDRRLAAMYCGFVENLWREGDIHVEKIVAEVILPVMLEDEIVRSRLMSIATDEFVQWINVI